MIKSQFHWLRSRACVVTAVEQHAIGADGLAQILTRVASEEGRLYRIAHKAEKMADRVTVVQTALAEYSRTMPADSVFWAEVRDTLPPFDTRKLNPPASPFKPEVWRK